MTLQNTMMSLKFDPAWGNKLKTLKRKTKLKNMKRKQRIEKRYVKVYNKTTGKKSWKSIPVIRKFDFDKKTQEWDSSEFHTPKYLANFCEYLKDLFCIDMEIHLKFDTDVNFNTGHCGWLIDPIIIKIGARYGILASTLIHEFLHAAGIEHKRNLNGYTDYMSTCTNDRYSDLICKDIFGRSEILLY